MSISRWALAPVLFLAFLCAAAAQGVKGPVGPDKIVYHLNAGLEQASNALEGLRNHLEVNPKAQIIVVAHAAGVDFLLKGAKTARGNEYRQDIEDLDFQGVKFVVCEITLRARGMTRSQFVKEAGFVPSGVAEIGRLQQREGYAYLRP
jgi:intracellular sulfur oxidation DsrE/DsrF family protein